MAAAPSLIMTYTYIVCSIRYSTIEEYSQSRIVCVFHVAADTYPVQYEDAGDLGAVLTLSRARSVSGMGGVQKH